MKIDMDKIIDAATKKMEDNAVKFSIILRKARNILLLLIIVIASIYLIKHEHTRIWGVVIFILSFAWLYSYVVKRRGTRKK
jgi:L-asparagine transporter-like permease